MLSRLSRTRIASIAFAALATAIWVPVANAQFTKSFINNASPYYASISLVTDPYDCHAAYVGLDGGLHYGFRSEVSGNWTNATFSLSGSPVAIALKPVTKEPYIVIAEAWNNFDTYVGHVVVAYRSGNFWFYNVVRPQGDSESPNLRAENVAITFASDGTPYVSYTMSGNGYDSLNVAHMSGSSWTVELADVQGLHVDIAIKVHPTTALPRVSFSRLDLFAQDYDLIYKERNSDGSWSQTVVEASGNTGNPQSLSQDASGNPAIAFVRNQEARLVYSRRDPVTGLWSKELLDQAAGLVGSVSLEIGTNNSPHIAYRTVNYDSVKYCTKVCGSWRFVRMFASSGTSQDPRSSVTLGLWANRHPRIAWLDTQTAGEQGKYQFATAQIGCGGGGGGGVIMPEAAAPPVTEPAATLTFGVHAPGTRGGMVRLAMNHSAAVTLSLHDLAGRQVARRELGVQVAGIHEVAWPLTELPSGLYFLRATTGDGQRAESRWVIVR